MMYIINYCKSPKWFWSIFFSNLREILEILDNNDKNHNNFKFHLCISRLKKFDRDIITNFPQNKTKVVCLKSTHGLYFTTGGSNFCTVLMVEKILKENVHTLTTWNKDWHYPQKKASKMYGPWGGLL